VASLIGAELRPMANGHIAGAQMADNRAAIHRNLHFAEINVPALCAVLGPTFPRRLKAAWEQDHRFTTHGIRLLCNRARLRHQGSCFPFRLKQFSEDSARGLVTRTSMRLYLHVKFNIKAPIYVHLLRKPRNLFVRVEKILWSTPDLLAVSSTYWENSR
jgi:hypothetical protein